ncbi:hypothetical protein GE21DRAFT_1251844 [Neurospora crassa]|nr:hypothetical protein GE21DRAFT_1251844 [Neurospora crassa]
MQEPLGLGDARQCMQGGGSGSAWVVSGRVTTSLPAGQRSAPSRPTHRIALLPSVPLHAHDAVLPFHIFRNDDDASQRSTLPVMIGLGWHGATANDNLQLAFVTFLGTLPAQPA